MGDSLQDPPWMPETMDSIEHILCSFLYVHSFFLKGGTLWVLFGISELPVSPLCASGPFFNKIRIIWKEALQAPDSRSDNCDGYSVPNWVDILDKGTVPILGRTERYSTRFHQATQNSTQFKTCQLLTSGIYHLILLDKMWPRQLKLCKVKRRIRRDCLLSALWVDDAGGRQCSRNASSDFHVIKVCRMSDTDR